MKTEELLASSYSYSVIQIVIMCEDDDQRMELETSFYFL